MKDKIDTLIVGGGGRSVALAVLLSRSHRIGKIFTTAPLYVGTLQIGKCINVPDNNIIALADFAKAFEIGLTVVAPEKTLGLGIADLFRSKRLRIFAPNQSAARFETSKAFSQRFMIKYGIPTADAGIFTATKPAKYYAACLGGNVAVKADGLCGARGVEICHSISEANEAIDRMLVKKVHCEAGETIVIQKLLEGTEISVHALCDGSTLHLFPESHDHKRARNHDKGKNTGGMGAYTPSPFVGSGFVEEVRDKILNPWLEGCKRENIEFRGLIYPGLMLTKDGPKVLEFNARFGDPETQAYMALLNSDLLEILVSTAEGRLSETELHWKHGVAVCVVMASKEYPETFTQSVPIMGLEKASMNSDAKIFHAETKSTNGKFYTNGGRVLSITSVGKNIIEARERAYSTIEKINFRGKRFRNDIGLKAERFIQQHT